MVESTCAIHTSSMHGPRKETCSVSHVSLQDPCVCLKTQGAALWIAGQSNALLTLRNAKEKDSYCSYQGERQ